MTRQGNLGRNKRLDKVDRETEASVVRGRSLSRCQLAPASGLFLRLSPQFIVSVFHGIYFAMERLDHKVLLEQFDLKRKSRQIAVSVDDVEVRAHLRDLNEPICKYSWSCLDRASTFVLLIFQVCLVKDPRKGANDCVSY